MKNCHCETSFMQEQKFSSELIFERNQAILFQEKRLDSGNIKNNKNNTNKETKASKQPGHL